MVPRSRIFLPRVFLAIVPGQLSLLLSGRCQRLMFLLVIALSVHPWRVTALLISGPRLLIVILRHFVRLKGSRISVNWIVVVAVAAHASQFVLLHFYALVAATPACRARCQLSLVAASWKEKNTEILNVIDESWINVRENKKLICKFIFIKEYCKFISFFPYFSVRYSISETKNRKIRLSNSFYQQLRWIMFLLVTFINNLFY